MVTGNRTGADPGAAAKDKGAPSKIGAAGDDACRCEEVSKMTPRQLLGLMLSDLAFWKKPKKE